MIFLHAIILSTIGLVLTSDALPVCNNGRGFGDGKYCGCAIKYERVDTTLFGCVMTTSRWRGDPDGDCCSPTEKKTCSELNIVDFHIKNAAGGYSHFARQFLGYCDPSQETGKVPVSTTLQCCGSSGCSRCAFYDHPNCEACADGYRPLDQLPGRCVPLNYVETTAPEQTMAIEQTTAVPTRFVTARTDRTVHSAASGGFVNDSGTRQTVERTLVRTATGKTASSTPDDAVSTADTDRSLKPGSVDYTQFGDNDRNAESSKSDADLVLIVAIAAGGACLYGACMVLAALLVVRALRQQTDSKTVDAQTTTSPTPPEKPLGSMPTETAAATTLSSSFAAPAAENASRSSLPTPIGQQQYDQVAHLPGAADRRYQNPAPVAAVPLSPDGYASPSAFVNIEQQMAQYRERPPADGSLTHSAPSSIYSASARLADDRTSLSSAMSQYYQ